MSVHTPFKHRIVTSYRNARYKSESGESIMARACWLSWMVPKKIIRRAVTLLLVAGLALGAGCSENEDNEREEDYDNDMRPAGADVYMCSGSEFINCTRGVAKYCEDKEETYSDCMDYCQEHFGTDYYSQGCDVTNSDNFCSCVQTTCDSDAPLGCDSEGNFWKCLDGKIQMVSCWDESECPFFEDAKYKKGLYAAYCILGDQTCQCIYTHSPISCSSTTERCVENSIWLACSEELYYEPVFCDNYCQNTYGESYIAVGCDDEAEEHCLCEVASTENNKK